MISRQNSAALSPNPTTEGFCYDKLNRLTDYSQTSTGQGGEGQKADDITLTPNYVLRSPLR